MIGLNSISFGAKYPVHGKAKDVDAYVKDEKNIAKRTGEPIAVVNMWENSITDRKGVVVITGKNDVADHEEHTKNSLIELQTTGSTTSWTEYRKSLPQPGRWNPESMNAKVLLRDNAG